MPLGRFFGFQKHVQFGPSGPGCCAHRFDFTCRFGHSCGPARCGRVYVARGRVLGSDAIGCVCVIGYVYLVCGSLRCGVSGGGQMRDACEWGWSDAWHGRWFRGSFNQHNPPAHPLPWPPIRPVWNTRGRTSLSSDDIKHHVIASPVPTKSLRVPTALLRALAWRFIYCRDSEQNVCFTRFQSVQLRPVRASPVTIKKMKNAAT